MMAAVNGTKAGGTDNSLIELLVQLLLALCSEVEAVQVVAPVEIEAQARDDGAADGADDALCLLAGYGSDADESA